MAGLHILEQPFYEVGALPKPRRMPLGRVSHYLVACADDGIPIALYSLAYGYSRAARPAVYTQVYD
jgi:hypothetical protein